MGEPVDSLSFLVHADQAQESAQHICRKLKDKIPRHQFVVSVQARLGNKIIAKEEIPCYRKNVTARCYGGDQSRKNKLLERQKEGKKDLRSVGKIQLPKEVFLDLLKN